MSLPAEIDPYSPTWVFVRNHALAQIEAGRTTLEARDQDAIRTEYVRGRISAMREIMGLVRADPPEGGN